MSDAALLDAIRRHALPLGRHGCGALLEACASATVVLLGEATHGTREFYRMRAQLTRALIEDYGFDAVAIEADWPDTLRLSQYAQGRGADPDTAAALSGFERFPRWMWRNREVAAFAHWLRQHNAGGRHVGIYGLDLYSLRASIAAVLRHLARTAPEAARRARERYACFDHFHEDPQRYGYATHFGLSESCETEVVEQLRELSERTAAARRGDSDGATVDELFYAEQHARVARNAEAYYRAMFGGRTASWNLRDTHMAETLRELFEHLAAGLGRPARIVVWAHNSHLGDARATEMGEDGQINLGQLAREQYGRNHVVSVGFTTHTGTVMAASEWDGPAEVKAVVPALPGSFERLFHEAGLGDFMLAGGTLDSVFGTTRKLERAIGVIYLPQSERYSHYFQARLAGQFDAIVHLDQTSALAPLDAPATDAGAPEPEPAETYPSGL